MHNVLSLAEFCKELSISVATGHNWIKLKKLVPSTIVNNTPYFTTEYMNSFKEKIQSNEDTILKSRRNKKYVSGNNLYNLYASDNSVNVSIIQELLNTIKNLNIVLTYDIILALISECAIRLINSKYNNKNLQESYLDTYIQGNLSLNGFEPLVNDIINNIKELKIILKNYKELFTFNYIYEQNEDTLGLIYISLKSIKDRKATGSYYTPTKLVKKLCNNLFKMNDYDKKTILDPCCGTGNFLLQLPWDIPFDYIYGNDIDEFSILIARINMALKYNITDLSLLYEHITKMDFLGSDFTGKYDFIIGNPPWGYEYSETEKQNLRIKYQCAVRFKH